jgi:acyl carrier protein
MIKAEFLKLMDQMMELSEGTLHPSDVLAKHEQWDSLATVGFIALADRHLGVAVDPSGVAKAKTVDDLLKLLGDKLK